MFHSQVLKKEVRVGGGERGRKAARFQKQRCRPARLSGHCRGPNPKLPPSSWLAAAGRLGRPLALVCWLGLLPSACLLDSLCSGDWLSLYSEEGSCIRESKCCLKPRAAKKASYSQGACGIGMPRWLSAAARRLHQAALTLTARSPGGGLLSDGKHRLGRWERCAV